MTKDVEDHYKDEEEMRVRLGWRNHLDDPSFAKDYEQYHVNKEQLRVINENRKVASPKGGPRAKVKKVEEGKGAGRARKSKKIWGEDFVDLDAMDLEDSRIC